MNKKKEIVPKFRFPKYVNSEQWISTELSSLLDYERPDLYIVEKYSLQGTTQGNGLTGGVPPVRFSM